MELSLWAGQDNGRNHSPNSLDQPERSNYWWCDRDDQVGCQKNHQFPLWTFDIQALRYMHLRALTMSTENQGPVWQCVGLENIETLTTGNFK